MADLSCSKCGKVGKIVYCLECEVKIQEKVRELETFIEKLRSFLPKESFNEEKDLSAFYEIQTLLEGEKEESEYSEEKNEISYKIYCPICKAYSITIPEGWLINPDIRYNCFKCGYRSKRTTFEISNDERIHITYE